jgi:hypothetical protein
MAVSLRQKVKTYFLPVQLATKGKQSPPFVGINPWKHRSVFPALFPQPGETAFCLVEQTNPAKSRVLLLDDKGT